MSRVCMIHVIYMQTWVESCHTNATAVSRLCMGHVTRMQESCYTYECTRCAAAAMCVFHPPIGTSRVTHVCELCRTCEVVRVQEGITHWYEYVEGMSNIFISMSDSTHHPHINESWHISKSHVIHLTALPAALFNRCYGSSSPVSMSHSTHTQS